MNDSHLIGRRSVRSSYDWIVVMLMFVIGGCDNVSQTESTDGDNPSRSNRTEAKHIDHLAGNRGNLESADPKDSGKQTALPDGPFSDVKRTPIDDSALRITIRRVSRSRIKLSVENVSKAPIGWDRECSVFVKWSITDSDGRAVNPTSTAGAIRLKSGVCFVELKPGEKYEHVLDLSAGIRVFQHARKLARIESGRSMWTPVGSEAKYAYRKRGEKKHLKISMVYDASDPDARDAFAVYFGFRPKRVRIGHVRASSNVLTLGLVLK